MARISLFGRLKDTVKKTVTRLFGVKFNEDKTHERQPPIQVQPEKPVSRLTGSGESNKFKELNNFNDSNEPSVYHDTDSISDFHKSIELDHLRDKYSDIISEANQRWELIESQGLESMAVSRVESEVGRNYFTLDEAQTEGDIIAEVTRARVFLADQTSTLEGAKLYTAEINSEQFKGKFGSKYRTPEYDNKGFDTTIIDEEYAKEVFRSYRMLEEEKQELIKSYGSENLIIAMYDARVRGNDPFLAGLDLIETWYTTKQKTWNDRFQQAIDRYNVDRSYPHGTVSDYLSGGVEDGEWGGDHSDELYF